MIASIFRNADQKVFIVKSADADPLALIDPLSLKSAGSAAAADMTQIGTNNGLRSVLRTTVARYSLSSPDASVRSDAVQEMSRSLDDATVALLREPAARWKRIPASGKKSPLRWRFPRWTVPTRTHVSRLSAR